MTLSDLEQAAEPLGLAVRGAFHPTPEDSAPDGTKTIVLLGPDEPQFWPLFQRAPEIQDGHPHPLDRWSRRVATSLGDPFRAQVILPYDGPPYAPFIRWAERCGTSWPSPVNLLVHNEAGLFISFRAALALPQALELPEHPSKPCDICSERPCETACPVGALSPGKPYDVPACTAHIKSAEGAACRNGCLVRRSCPVSQKFGRVPEQSAFHMRAFLGE